MLKEPTRIDGFCVLQPGGEKQGLEGPREWRRWGNELRRPQNGEGENKEERRQWLKGRRQRQLFISNMYIKKNTEGVSKKDVRRTMEQWGTTM